MVQEFGGQMLPFLEKLSQIRQLGRVATGNILKANGILGAGFEWYGFTSGTHGTAFEMGCGFPTMEWHLRSEMISCPSIHNLTLLSVLTLHEKLESFAELHLDLSFPPGGEHSLLERLIVTIPRASAFILGSRQSAVPKPELFINSFQHRLSFPVSVAEIEAGKTCTLPSGCIGDGIDRKSPALSFPAIPSVDAIDRCTIPARGIEEHLPVCSHVHDAGNVIV